VADRKDAYLRMRKTFEEKMGAVQSELERIPFGDPGRLETALTDLSDWLTDELIQPVSQRPFDHAARQRVRKMMVLIGGSERHDYDSARQIAWALRTLCCDLTQQTAVQTLFDKLSTSLRLDFPNALTGDCGTQAVVGDVRDAPVPLTSTVAAALATEVRYDPDEFRETMNALRRLLE